MIITASFNGQIGKTTTAVHLARQLLDSAPTLLIKGYPNRSASCQTLEDVCRRVGAIDCDTATTIVTSDHPFRATARVDRTDYNGGNGQFLLSSRAASAAVFDAWLTAILLLHDKSIPLATGGVDVD